MFGVRTSGLLSACNVLKRWSSVNRIRILGRYFCARTAGSVKAAAAPIPADFRNCRLVLRDILPVMLRIIALLFTIGAIASAAGLERRLYVTDRSGISVYDIDNGHKLLR